MLAVQPQPLLLPYNPLENCWDHLTTSAIQAWDVIWEKGSVIPHVITWIFFRVVSIIIPAVVGFEVLLCHAIALLQGLRYSAKEADHIVELDNLRPLGAANQQLRDEAVATQLAIARLRGERDHARNDIGGAHAERDAALEGKAALIHERDQLLVDIEKLQVELRAAVDQSSAAANDILSLQRENESLLERAENLDKDLQQASCDRELIANVKHLKKMYEAKRARGELFEQHLVGREEALDQFEKVNLAEVNRSESYRALLEERKIGLKEGEESLKVIIDSMIQGSYQDQAFKEAMKLFFEVERELYVKLQEVSNECNDSVKLTKPSITLEQLEQ